MAELRVRAVLCCCLLAVARAEVPAVCQDGTASSALAAGPSTPDGVTQVVTDGRAFIGAPRLCSSYTCRAALLQQQHSLPVGMALTQELLQCALPEVAGSYELLDFVVTGFPSDEEDVWWNWVLQALVDLQVDRHNIVKSTWFPMGGGLQFYVSSAPGLNATGLLTLPSLTKVLARQAQPSWSGSLASPVTVRSLRLSATDVERPPGEVAREDLYLVGLASVFAVIYVLLAVTAHFFGPPWLRPLVLCWSDLCHGGACLVYRVLFCPFVLLYNACRIYCWSCCMSYLLWYGHAPCCKSCCFHLYEDPDFPASDHSVNCEKIGGDTASGVRDRPLRGCEWRRAADIAREPGTKEHLFNDTIEPNDVQQGQLGDCWLMAAIASVARRPEVLEQCIVTKYVDPRGKYHFRLWNQVKGTKGTKWVDIYIDDRIPVDKVTKQPLFARAPPPQPKEQKGARAKEDPTPRTHETHEMWVMLLEKAFAKMYGGYDRLEGGQMSWALTAMTGNDAFVVKHHAAGDPTIWQWTDQHGDSQQVECDKLFQLLWKLSRNGAFMCCASLTDKAKQSPRGLIDGHAYSLVRVVELSQDMFGSNTLRLVQVRNPHGRGEWHGDWSDKSDMWAKYPKIEKKIKSFVDGETFQEDGMFWMSWTDFTESFCTIEIVDCAVNIRTLLPPYHDRVVGAPIVNCLHGCRDYWCLCLGFRRLYFGREKCKDLLDLEKGIDQQVGFDQSGLFCHLWKKHRRSPGSSKTKGTGEAEPDEMEPLCGWASICDHVGSAVKPNGRVLSRTGAG